MPSLQRFAAGDDPAAIFAALADDGGVIVQDLFDSAFCDSMAQDFAAHLDEVPWGVDEIGYVDEFYGNRTKRLHGLVSRSPLTAQAFLHPLLLAMADHFLVASRVGQDYRVSNMELMVLGQDQGNQAMHTDAASWRLAQKLMDREILVSANVALTDFTATNGATRVAPGSHRWPAGRQPGDDEITLATMPRGSALLYTGNVLHSGGSNTESDVRIGLYIGYVTSWLRPLENYLVTNDPADVLALPEPARRLLDIVPGGLTIYA